MNQKLLKAGLFGFLGGAFFFWNYIQYPLLSVQTLLGGVAIALLVMLYTYDLPSVIKSGLLAGLFGAIITIIYGVEKPGVALIAGMFAGLFAGLLAHQRNHQSTVAAGARQGGIAGVVAGLWTVAALFLTAFVISPAAGFDAVSFTEHLEDTVLFAKNLHLGSDIGILLYLSVLSVLIAGLLGAAGGAAVTLPVKPNLVLLGVIAIPILLVPLIDKAGSLLLLDPLIKLYVFILLALGLNIVVGYAGLLDLGYAAFFAIGAYTAAILSMPDRGIGINFWLVIWIAAAVAAIAGLILGAPTLPLRGDYLAIVTLGFGEIVPILVRNLGGGPPTGTLTLRFFNQPIGIEQRDLTGGTAGIGPIPPPHLPAIGDFTPANKIPWYYLIVVIMVIVIFFINRLRGSRQGRAWTALREDELAADAMGINIVRTKLMAFAMGATFSGFGGAFYGAFIGSIFPSSFDFSVSILLLCMVILGGLGNMAGVIIGGLLIMGADVMFLPEGARLIGQINATRAAAAGESLVGISALQDLTQQRLLLFGMVLVIMMLVRPEGLLPSEQRKAELHPESEHILDQENSVAMESEKDPLLAEQ